MKRINDDDEFFLILLALTMFFTFCFSTLLSLIFD